MSERAERPSFTIFVKAPFDSETREGGGGGGGGGGMLGVVTFGEDT